MYIHILFNIVQNIHIFNNLFTNELTRLIITVLGQYMCRKSPSHGARWGILGGQSPRLVFVTTLLLICICLVFHGEKNLKIIYSDNLFMYKHCTRSHCSLHRFIMISIYNYVSRSYIYPWMVPVILHTFKRS